MNTEINVADILAQLAPIFVSLATLITSIGALIATLRGNAKIEKVNGNVMRVIEASTATAEMKGRLDGMLEGVRMTPRASRRTDDDSPQHKE